MMKRFLWIRNSMRLSVFTVCSAASKATVGMWRGEKVKPREKENETQSGFKDPPLWPSAGPPVPETPPLLIPHLQTPQTLFTSLLHLSSHATLSSWNSLYSLLLQLLVYARHVAHSVWLCACCVFVANMKASSNCFPDSDGVWFINLISPGTRSLTHAQKCVVHSKDNYLLGHNPVPQWVCVCVCCMCVSVCDFWEMSLLVVQLHDFL